MVPDEFKVECAEGGECGEGFCVGSAELPPLYAEGVECVVGDMLDSLGLCVDVDESVSVSPGFFEGGVGVGEVVADKEVVVVVVCNDWDDAVCDERLLEEERCAGGEESLGCVGRLLLLCAGSFQAGFEQGCWEGGDRQEAGIEAFVQLVLGLSDVEGGEEGVDPEVFGVEPGVMPEREVRDGE